MQSKLHSIKEVSEILGVNRNTAYELVHSGHLQALKLGSLKVPTFELNDFMKRSIGKDFTDLENVKELSL